MPAKLIHHFEPMTPEKRPQDPHLDGTGLMFETLEHGGDEPDTMPQASMDYALAKACASGIDSELAKPATKS